MRTASGGGRVVLLAGLVLGSACAAVERSGEGRERPPSAGIVIDGAFGDWEGAPVVVEDPPDAPDSPLDLRRVRAAHDAAAVYLLLEFERPVVLQGLPGVLRLLLDGDGDPATGATLFGLEGVDVAVEFSAPNPFRPSGPGSGIAVRRYVGGDRAEEPEAGPVPPPEPVRPASVPPPDAGRALAPPLDPYVLGLDIAPKYVTRRAEIRIPRGTRLPDVPPLFAGDGFRGKLVYVERSGAVLDEVDGFAVELAVSPRTSVPEASQGTDPLARPEGTDFRAVVWNVAREAFLRHPEPFARVLEALGPDLVLLDEVPPGSSAERIAELLPSGDEPWRVAFGEGGGAQRGIVAIRAPLERVETLRRVPYPDSLDEVLARAGRDDLLWQLRNAAEDGVPVMGAVVPVAGRRLLTIVLDLQCCGDGEGSAEDRVRRMEAAEIRAAVRRTLESGSYDGILIGGDLNLVGSRFPFRALRRGLDLDGSDLARAVALQLDGISHATWDEGRGRFPPGRLDFVLYGDAALSVARAFVFDSRDLSPEWRSHHGLDEGISSRASDHFPIVADFRWRPRPGRGAPGGVSSLPGSGTGPILNPRRAGGGRPGPTGSAGSEAGASRRRAGG